MRDAALLVIVGKFNEWHREDGFSVGAVEAGVHMDRAVDLLGTLEAHGWVVVSTDALRAATFDEPT